MSDSPRTPKIKPSKQVNPTLFDDYRVPLPGKGGSAPLKVLGTSGGFHTATPVARHPAVSKVRRSAIGINGEDLLLIEFDDRTKALTLALRDGPAVYAKEMRALLSLAAYQSIVPEIQVRTPTRKFSRKNPKLRFSVYIRTRLEETLVYQGGTSRSNYVPWWGFIIEHGSVPHFLGKGGKGGGFHPGFPATNQFSRGVRAGIPEFTALMEMSVSEFVRWMSGHPTQTGRFSSEVSVQNQHRRAMDHRWRKARRALITQKKLTLRSMKDSKVTANRMLPGMVDF